MNTMLNLNQAVTLISSVGTDISVHVQGSPGIGKSSMLKTLASMYPTHEPVYIDCADLDLGDLAMPAMNHELKSTSYYPNERFGLHKGVPVIIMLDELTKASEPVKNMLLPVLLERRLGSVKFHPDSIVFSTGNLTSDGVGDTLKAHAKNRVTIVNLRTPNADEFVAWGIDNNVVPEVMAWVKAFPHALAMYTDESQADNLYIYNPRKQQSAFVSPRSLEKASHIVRRRKNMDEDTLITALSGTIGEAAARDMSAYFTLADQLPSREFVYKSPEIAPIPENPAARIILVLRELVSVTEENLTTWMTYLRRMPMEEQALFAVSIMASSRRSMAASNREFVEWAVKENKYF